MVTGPEQGARQPHGHGPPAHGLRSRARGRDPALSPGSARFQGRWHPPCPHRAGPLCDPPGWAGGLVPAADTHHRRPAVSCTGQGKPGLSAGPSRPQRRRQPVHRRPGTLGGWGKGTVTNGGGRPPLRCREPSGTWPQSRGRCQWPCFCTSSQPYSQARGRGHKAPPQSGSRSAWPRPRVGGHPRTQPRLLREALVCAEEPVLPLPGPLSLSPPVTRETPPARRKRPESPDDARCAPTRGRDPETMRSSLARRAGSGVSSPGPIEPALTALLAGVAENHKGGE